MTVAYGVEIDKAAQRWLVRRLYIPLSKYSARE